MPIVSHLHHLFNPETCQSYIHLLRWKDPDSKWVGSGRVTLRYVSPIPP
jgi:hypothetical protein